MIKRCDADATRTAEEQKEVKEDIMQDENEKKEDAAPPKTPPRTPPRTPPPASPSPPRTPASPSLSDEEKDDVINHGALVCEGEACECLFVDRMMMTLCAPYSSRREKRAANSEQPANDHQSGSS